MLLLAVIVFSVGCSADEPTPIAESAPEETIVEEAPAADSIEVVDDERSLERRIEDAAIATQVRIALVDASELKRFEFDPQVVNGRVILQGEVNTQNQRNRAAEIAKGVTGVRDVTNRITAVEEPMLASETTDTTAADTSDQLAQAEEETAEDPAAAPSETPESEPPQQAEQATYHTVKSGESLWTISRNYGVTIAQIRRLNDLTSNNLRPGQRLQVK